MRILSFALVATLVLLLAAPLAGAHKTTYSPDDKVKIVWGFLNEPAVTMTKTGLDLILTDNATGAPIEGVEKTLTASLVLGGETREFEDFRAQHGQKGRYTDVITLTRPGLYSLRLVGTINGTPVDMTIPGAHEVEAIEATHFPALPEATDADLAARLAALEAKVAALEATSKVQSETPAAALEQGDNKVPFPTFAATLAIVGAAAILMLRRRA